MRSASLPLLFLLLSCSSAPVHIGNLVHTGTLAATKSVSVNESLLGEEDLSLLETGVTTKSEVDARFGDEFVGDWSSDGVEYARSVYLRLGVDIAKAMFGPLVGGRGSSTRVQLLILTFSKNDRVLRVCRFAYGDAANNGLGADGETDRLYIDAMEQEIGNELRSCAETIALEQYY